MTTDRNAKEALMRGMMGRCPKCGKGKVFNGYLTVVERCDSCGEPLGLYRAADGPAFFTMTIMLLLLIPLLGFTWIIYRPSPLVLLAVTASVVALLTLVILRLVKGAFIGYLWAHDEQDRGA